MRDRLALGVISGVAAQAIKWPLSTLALSLGFAKQVDSQVAAGILLSKEAAMTLGGYALGTLSAFIIAATLGVLVVYVLSLTGDDWWWLKGAGVAAVALIGAFGILTNLGGSNVVPTNFGSSLVNSVLYITWGVLTAYFARRWGADELFGGVEKLD